MLMHISSGRISINLLSNTDDTGEPDSQGECDWLLYHGIKNLLRCDEAETVHGIADYVISQYRSLRIGSEFIERHRQTPIAPVAAFLGAVTRFLEVRAGQSRDGAIWVARLDNERRVLETLPALLPDLNWTEWTFHRRPDGDSISALKRILLPNRRRIIRLARLLLRRRYEFFKVLRVAELIGYYARYLDLFRQGRFNLAVMSSHSNPHGIAFNLAARKCGVPVILITHGMPIRPVARLHYDLAVVHCEAARRTYLEEGCKMNRVLIHGRREHYAPIPERLRSAELTIGIFLCKDVHERRLRALVERLLNHPQVSRILIRPHPKNLWLGLDDWIASRNDARIDRSSGDSVFRDIEMSDVVLAGNSSVLVDAVTAGRLSGYIPGIDYGSPDLHAFVLHGLIYPIQDDLSFDPDAMLRFYHRPQWLTALRLFANIDEDESSVAAQISDAMRELNVSRKAAAGNGAAHGRDISCDGQT